ncbi:thioesterase II family protein [Paenibacillus sp. CH40]|uniref:thioesterase II family protein n=1 Tax=Paenibacillus sp. CH40 TaxID=2962045 RepID=UPI0020B7CEBC|nr:alpha/beta fold hydrolase [Paenibacillus sp. CH40]MCP3797608.1 alpha/beta fold hydrolase [Paenibacillus sp. CH40]
MTTRSQSWFAKTEVQPTAKLQLFCFPYAGGGAYIFNSWKSRFAPDITVLPIQLPGRESRSTEAPMDTLQDIVQSLVPAMAPYMHKPFAFFGHSMGALIAFETARQLYSKTGKLPVHIIISGKSAPHLPYSKKRLHDLADDSFTEELRLMQGTPEEVLQNAELMQIIMPRLRADFKVCETYVYQPGNPLVCPMTVLGGMKDFEVSTDSLHAWQQHTTSPMDVQMFEGNHFFIHEQEQEVLSAVENILSTSSPMGHAAAARTAYNTSTLQPRFRQS